MCEALLEFTEEWGGGVGLRVGEVCIFSGSTHFVNLTHCIRIPLREAINLNTCNSLTTNRRGVF